MIKTVLYDINGVLIKSDGEIYFSDRYSKEFGVSKEEILTFVNNEAKLSKVGKADLKKELEKYLVKWHWKSSVDDLLRYWYDVDYKVNIELLDYIYQHKQKGVRAYIVSDNEKYAAQRLLSMLDFNTHFDGAYFSYQLETTKADPKFFKHILEELSEYRPEELILCDDRQRNLDTAASLGINTHLYTSNKDFFASMPTDYRLLK